MAGTENNQEAVSSRKSAAWPKIARFLASALVFVAIAYLVAAGYMYIFQRNFLFVPSGQLATPAEKGLNDVAVTSVEMADGTKTTVWTAHPAEEGAPVVLYYHGNSGNVSSRWKRFQQILNSGFGLYAPSYRGYAGSGGSPSEAKLISDALEHFEHAAAMGAPLIVHGESLGTGVATAVAVQHPDIGLLVLEAPYTALVDRAFEQYPWLPVSLLMKDQMPTRERIGGVLAPVLILHGTEDVIIPVEHGKALFERATDPKKLLIIDGANHNNLWSSGLWPAVLEAWRKSKSR